MGAESHTCSSAAFDGCASHMAGKLPARGESRKTRQVGQSFLPKPPLIQHRSRGLANLPQSRYSKGLGGSLQFKPFNIWAKCVSSRQPTAICIHLTISYQLLVLVTSSEVHQSAGVCKHTTAS